MGLLSGWFKGFKTPASGTSGQEGKINELSKRKSMERRVFERLLIHACQANDLKAAQKSLRLSKDTSIQGDVPLQWAFKHQNEALVALLMKHKAVAFEWVSDQEVKGALLGMMLMSDPIDFKWGFDHLRPEEQLSFAQWMDRCFDAEKKRRLAENTGPKRLMQPFIGGWSYDVHEEVKSLLRSVMEQQSLGEAVGQARVPVARASSAPKL